MSRPSPKRDQLVATATRLFCAEGFHATGIDRVLEEAGVAKMTLYKHFASKDELIAACLAQVADVNRAAFDRALEAAEGDPVTRLRRALGTFAARAAQAGFTGCPFHHAQAEFAAPEHPAHCAVVEYKAWFRGRIEELLTEAGLEDPRGRADEVLLAFEGALAVAPLRVVDDLPDRLDRLVGRTLTG